MESIKPNYKKDKKIDPIKLYYTKEYYAPLSMNVIDFPKMLVLQGSSFCNFNCIMCQRNVKVKKREKTKLGNGYMSVQLIKKIVDECKNIKDFLGLQFALYGEPLLNPDIVKIIEVIKKGGVKVQIVTNGSMLEEEMIRKLINAGLDKIKISFQGASPEKYKLWRDKDYYSKLVSIVHNVVRIRDKMKSDLFVQVGTSSADDTIEELKDFISYWKKIVDHVYWNYTCLLHLQDDPVINNLKILRQAPKNTKKCWELFKRMAVMWNGKVVRCVNDEEHFIGDLNTQSIREIWNGEIMNKYRSTILAKGNILEGCEYCTTQPDETKNYKYRYNQKKKGK